MDYVSDRWHSPGAQGMLAENGSRPPMNDGATCLYCSGMATVWDHVLPRSLMRGRISGASVRIYAAGDWIVTCCHECNSFLGNRWITTIPARANFLVGRYRRKYRSALNAPYWDEEELEELEGTLRIHLQDCLSQQRELDARLAHLMRIAAMPEDYFQP